MRVDTLALEGPLLITPRVIADGRGHFLESWNQRRFDEALGEAIAFAQDNHSRYSRGVLRGLHYQLQPAGAPHGQPITRVSVRPASTRPIRLIRRGSVLWLGWQPSQSFEARLECFLANQILLGGLHSRPGIVGQLTGFNSPRAQLSATN